MSKKRYFIVTPIYKQASRYSKVRAAARSYYGDREYEPLPLRTEVSDLISNFIRGHSTDKCNSDMLMAGLTLAAMSEADSVYFAKDWENDDASKFCHLMAFKYGLEIAYEPQ